MQRTPQYEFVGGSKFGRYYDVMSCIIDKTLIYSGILDSAVISLRVLL
uniref:Uncharacterized protein n=1 Tax=Anguilla anguilla TaxID=7936 RepID=A0A0E9RE81_ANGAN